MATSLCSMFNGYIEHTRRWTSLDHVSEISIDLHVDFPDCCQVSDVQILLSRCACLGPPCSWLHNMTWCDKLQTNANKPNSLETPYNILWHHTTSLYTCIDCICIALYSLLQNPTSSGMHLSFLSVRRNMLQTCNHVSVHNSCPLEQRCLCWYSWASYSTNMYKTEARASQTLWMDLNGNTNLGNSVAKKCQDVPRVSVTKSRKSSTAPCPL